MLKPETNKRRDPDAPMLRVDGLPRETVRRLALALLGSTSDVALTVAREPEAETWGVVLTGDWDAAWALLLVSHAATEAARQGRGPESA